jgi:hypothetical protein
MIGSFIIEVSGKDTRIPIKMAGNTPTHVRFHPSLSRSGAGILKAPAQCESPLPSSITLSVFRLAARRTDLNALIPLLEPAPVSEKPVGLNRSRRRMGYGR